MWTARPRLLRISPNVRGVAEPSVRPRGSLIRGTPPPRTAADAGSAAPMSAIQAHARPPSTDLRSEGAAWEYAGWLRRVAASLIDTAVLFGGLLAGVLVLGVWESSSGRSGDVVAAVVISVFLLSLFLYDPICHAVWQQTVGKRAMGIALTLHTGERASFGRALWRHLAKLALAVVPLLGLLDALNPLASRKNQTVHDAVARTVVVRVR
jgi:uncharacterized RDD family membrane protein YckC